MYKLNIDLYVHCQRNVKYILEDVNLLFIAKERERENYCTDLKQVLSSI